MYKHRQIGKENNLYMQIDTQGNRYIKDFFSFNETASIL